MLFSRDGAGVQVKSSAAIRVSEKFLSDLDVHPGGPQVVSERVPETVPADYLVDDYEIKPPSSETMIHIAFAHLLLRRRSS
jgi:hypothetical protein